RRTSVPRPVVDERRLSGAGSSWGISIANATDEVATTGRPTASTGARKEGHMRDLATSTGSASTCSAPDPQPGDLGALVLAGGEGLRLQPLMRQLYGEARPKQYAVLTNGRSMLRQTLDRVALLIPPERTVIVTQNSHARYLSAELTGFPRPQVIAQPCDRGTAAGVLLPTHWVLARGPRAAAAVVPAAPL